MELNVPITVEAGLRGHDLLRLRHRGRHCIPGNGILSTQVLQEFFVNVTKKIPRPVPVAIGREIVEDFLKWKVVPVEGRTILRAIDLHEKHKYAFWDSLVIQSAIEGGARWLLSEDLRDGQRIGDLTIRNPFLHE